MAVLRPSLSIPKTPTGSMVPGTLEEQSAESVPQAEEQQDHERHDDRDERDHRRHRGAFVAHIIDLPRAPSGRNRSGMRKIEPVATATPSGPAASRAAASARRG